MPRLVSRTTPNRFTGSGPKKEANTPGTLDTAASCTWASASMEAVNPPLAASTASTTATMPTSMMMPWMKSFTAVAM